MSEAPQVRAVPAPASWPTDEVGRTFESLGERNFRLWFGGQTISMVGYFAQVIALAVLLLDLGAGGLVLGSVTALYFIPTLFIGPWAGVLSDRRNKRRLLIVTQGAAMACALAIGALVLSDSATVPRVAVLAALAGAASAFDQPARRTIVTELVPAAGHANAVSLNGALNQAAKIFGPAVAGVLVNTVGVGWCFIANGLSSIAVIAALARMDPATMYPSPLAGRTAGQATEGFRFVWDDRMLRATLGMLGVVTLLGFNWNVVFPLLAVRELGGDSTALVVLMGSMSAGSVAGILWLARRRTVRCRVLAWSCLTFAAASGLLAAAPSVAVAAAVVPVLGAAAMVLSNGGAVVLQLATPQVLRGRVMALFSMVVVGGTGVGSLLAGWIADIAGARANLVVGTAAAMGAAGFLWRVVDDAAPPVRLLPSSPST